MVHRIERQIHQITGDTITVKLDTGSRIKYVNLNRFDWKANKPCYVGRDIELQVTVKVRNPDSSIIEDDNLPNNKNPKWREWYFRENKSLHGPDF